MPLVLFIFCLFLLQDVAGRHENDREILRALDQVKSQQRALAQSIKRLKVELPTTKPGPKIVPKPSRNPAKDITGASARLMKRTATQNQCARACNTLMHCLSTSSICPKLGTDDTRQAVLQCAAVCAQEKSTLTQLLDMTDCPSVIDPDVPPSLRSICVDSQ